MKEQEHEQETRVDEGQPQACRPTGSTAADNEPIPLLSPDGRVFAYACAHCEHVSASISGGTFQGRLEWSREGATRCCRCRGCGAVGRFFGSLCEPCRKAEDERAAPMLQASRDAHQARVSAQETALATAVDRDAARLLLTLMEDISETHWAAGWMSGLEFSLWGIVTGDRGSDFGMFEVETREIEELRRLSSKAGGWFRYDDEIGETFVPIADWLERYREAQSPAIGRGNNVERGREAQPAPEIKE